MKLFTFWSPQTKENTKVGIHVSQSYYCTARILANSLHAEQGRGQLSIGRQGLREPLVRSTVDLRNLES